MEDYVTFEQALRLKELGFDWYNQYTQMYYATQCYCEGNNPIYFDTIGTGDLISSPKMKEDENDGWIEDEDYCVLAPTLSQAQKWLREEKGIFIDVFLNASGYGWELNKTKPIYETNGTRLQQYDFKGEHEDSGMWHTYEKALSAGIDKALELLI